MLRKKIVNSKKIYSFDVEIFFPGVEFLFINAKYCLKQMSLSKQNYAKYKKNERNKIVCLQRINKSTSNIFFL